MSYCGRCLRDLTGISSMQCPCNGGYAGADTEALDKIIALHRCVVDPDREEYCGGCFNEWPCETKQIIEKWGSAMHSWAAFNRKPSEGEL